VAVKKALYIVEVSHSLACLRAIASADEHDFTGEIAGVRRKFRKTRMAGSMQFDRPAITSQTTTPVGDRSPWQRPDPLVVREQTDTQRMARRVSRRNTAECCPQDLATFAYIAPKQELEQILPINGIAGIAEQHLRGRAVKRKTRKIDRVR
jgi:hypothetical protein